MKIRNISTPNDDQLLTSKDTPRQDNPVEEPNLVDVHTETPEPITRRNVERKPERKAEQVVERKVDRDAGHEAAHTSGCVDLEELIGEITDMMTTQDARITHIKHPEYVVDTLRELRDVIGMGRCKAVLTKQIRSLIYRSKCARHHDMLNMVIYGSKGAGKTTLAKLISKLYWGLGFIEEPAKSGRFADSFQVSSPQGVSSTDSMTKTLYGVMILVYLLIAVYYLKEIFAGYGIEVVLVGIAVALIALLGYLSQQGNTVAREKTATSLTRSSSRAQRYRESDMFVCVTPTDLIAGYMGQTALKTRSLLHRCKGKVLFIDEAYNLMMRKDDSFGMEAITELNAFLSEHPNDLIVILAGYRDEMSGGIFKFQSGLARRFMFHLECDPYQPDELYKIFKSQLLNHQYTVNPVDDARIESLFQERAHLLHNQAGDTLRLAYYASLELDSKYLKSEGSRLVGYEVALHAFDELVMNNIAGTGTGKGAGAGAGACTGSRGEGINSARGGTLKYDQLIDLLGINK